MREKVKAEIPDVRITALAVSGEPAEALLRTADNLDEKVIVVVNKRFQGMARVLGSFAREVAARAL